MSEETLLEERDRLAEQLAEQERDFDQRYYLAEQRYHDKVNELDDAHREIVQLRSLISDLEHEVNHLRAHQWRR